MFSSLLTILLVGQTGLISGTVVDSTSSQPVEGASVIIAGTGLGMATRETGGFVLGPVQAGRFRVVASHIAFSPETLAVDVPANGVGRLTFRLAAKSIPVPPVNVRSRREPGETKVTVREISSEQLERNAGGFVQDPVRSLSFLPGVGHSSRGEWSGTYVVRGGEPDESSVWFGSTELLWPYHLLGFSSVINSDIVDKMEFYPSVFPSQYGGALSSIAVIRPKDLDRGEGYWAYDPMNMKAAYVGNLADIRFLGSFRRTFYNLLFGPIGAGRSSKLSYSDITGQVTLPLGASNRLRATFVSGSDDIATELYRTYEMSLYLVDEQMSEGSQDMSVELLSELGPLRSDLSVYDNTHDFYIDPAEWWGTASTRERESGLRWDVTGTLSPQLDVSGGMEVGRAVYGGNLLSPSLFQRADNSAAAYASASLRPVPVFGLDLGIRYEDVRWALDKVLEPRAVATFYLGDNVTLKAGYRRHYQDSYSFLRSSFALTAFDDDYSDYRLFEQSVLGAKRADHYSLSGEFKLGTTARMSVEGYVKDYSQLPTWQEDDRDSLYGFGNAGYGFARGVELTFEHAPVAGWSGWLTYGLSWCRKKQGTDTALYWDEYDRRHSLSVVVEKEFPGKLALTATFHLNTGEPYTPLLYTQPGSGVDAEDYNHGRSAYVIEGVKNSARVPLYHRLDLKLSKELPNLPLHPRFYIEILNAYNRENAYRLVQFVDPAGEIVTGQFDGIQFIPLVGIGGRF